MSKEGTFWFTWLPGAADRYHSEETARKAAERIVARTGVTHYVVKAVAKYEKTIITTTNLEEPNDL